MIEIVETKVKEIHKAWQEGNHLKWHFLDLPESAKEDFEAGICFQADFRAEYTTSSPLKEDEFKFLGVNKILCYAGCWLLVRFY